MTKLHVSTNFGLHQVLYPTDLYVLRVFIYSMQPRVDVEVSSSRILS